MFKQTKSTVQKFQDCDSGAVIDDSLIILTPVSHKETKAQSGFLCAFVSLCETGIRSLGMKVRMQAQVVPQDMNP